MNCVVSKKLSLTASSTLEIILTLRLPIAFVWLCFLLVRNKPQSEIYFFAKTSYALID